MDDQYLDDQLLPSDTTEEGLDGELSFGDAELKAKTKKADTTAFIENDEDVEDEVMSLDDVVAEEEDNEDEDEDEDE